MAGLLPFLLIFGTCTLAFSHGMQLEKVLILSRHNIRTPLTGNLQMFSTKQWPKWEEGPGELTKKGAKLEGYLGDYFSEWMTSHNLFSGNCEDVHIYANVKQRTKESAKHFANAFRDCQPTIPVEYAADYLEMDPIFNPIIHNTSIKFAEEVKKAMKAKLSKTNLADAFKELYRITDMENSDYCKSGCALAMNGKSKIIVEAGKEPDFSEALFIGNALVDAFIMSYYNGFDTENIAWGEINSNDQWDLLLKISQANQNIRFGIELSAKDVAKPFLEYMKKMLNEKKITALFGHDANLNSVISALDFKSFKLPGQKEVAPIAAKLVFQKWKNGTKYFLKVEYVYQTWEQIRNAEKFSLENPPRNVTMYFSKMADYGGGLYLWDDFIQKLDELTQ